MATTDGDEDALRLEAAASRLAIFGELDAATAHLLEAALVEAAAVAAADGDGAGDGRSELVVDCAGLEFVDSSGLNVLVRHAQRLASTGVHLVVASPRPSTMRLFEIAGLDRVLTIRQ